MSGVYRLTENETIIRIEDLAFIPPDPLNRDYMDYLKWIEEGNVPDPKEVPQEPVPASISDRQFFQQLAIAGIISEDEALASNAAVIPAPLLVLVNQLPEEDQFNAKMILSGATTFERNHPLTISIGSAYGMSSDQIDEFFKQASVL